ncbi:MAG: thioredoxin [Nitrosomonadaceae bacterium]|nr:thioredoxin [Nitrosomonadaceae bacterium]MDW7665438.1 thioredoxin [Nitrosomonadaceae bacterium]
MEATQNYAFFFVARRVNLVIIKFFWRLTMKTSAIFYHAGCPVCIEAEHQVAEALDLARYDVKIVHLGEQKDQISVAEGAGVKSVPALVIGGAAFHINFGAPMSALKG